MVVKAGRSLDVEVSGVAAYEAPSLWCHRWPLALPTVLHALLCLSACRDHLPLCWLGVREVVGPAGMEVFEGQGEG